MEMIFCPNCQKLTGYQRAFGFGTLFAVLITCGFWLFVLGFYPQRCIACGLRKSDSLPSNNRWAFGLLLVVGLFIFGKTMTRLFPDSMLPHAVGNDTRSTDYSNGGESLASASSIKHNIGESVPIGYWFYRCNGAHWATAIPSGYSRLEFPDAAFLVVDMTIRNDDRTPSTLPPLRLVDTQGREYEESSKGMFMPGSFDLLKKLNPGVSSRGYVIFDAPRGYYSLEVSGGFESGKKTLINLNSEPEPQVRSEQAISPRPSEDAVTTQQAAPIVPDGGATDTEVYRVSDGATLPTAIYSPDPEYTEDARAKKVQGICVLTLMVGPDGNPSNITVTRALGSGLDEKAVESVQHWKFKPGMKDGKPIAMTISVEVDFHFY